MLAGTLTNFKVVLSAPPGGVVANSWTFEVRVNGVAAASCNIPNTGLSCTIAGPVVFTDAQYLSVRADENGTAAATRVAFKADYTFAP
jgi:hypothetical protein